MRIQKWKKYSVRPKLHRTTAPVPWGTYALNLLKNSKLFCDLCVRKKAWRGKPGVSAHAQHTEPYVQNLGTPWSSHVAQQLTTQSYLLHFFRRTSPLQFTVKRFFTADFVCMHTNSMKFGQGYNLPNHSVCMRSKDWRCCCEYSRSITPFHSDYHGHINRDPCLQRRPPFDHIVATVTTNDDAMPRIVSILESARLSALRAANNEPTTDGSGNMGAYLHASN